MKNKKYFYHKNIDRERIAIPQEEDMIEMHRNVRFDLYGKKFDKKLKKYLSFKNLSKYPQVEKLYTKLAKFNNLEENNFLVTAGIDAGLKTIFEMCSQKNSKVICLTPTYAMYQVYADAFEVEMVKINSKRDFSIDLKELLDSIDYDIDIVFLPNPHIPIENIFYKEEIEQVLEKAKKTDTLVVIDEAYYMFGSPTMINLIDKYDNLVVARTFSKGFGLPAIRVGYLVANKDLISYLSSKRFAHELNSLAIDIAIFAIDNFKYFKKYANKIQENRDWLKNKLRNKGIYVFGDKSNTILIDCYDKDKVDFLAEKMKEKKFIVKNNMTTPAGSFISVTIGKKKVMKRFLTLFLNFYWQY